MKNVLSRPLTSEILMGANGCKYKQNILYLIRKISWSYKYFPDLTRRWMRGAMENEHKQKINHYIRWKPRRLYLNKIFNWYQKGAYPMVDTEGGFT
jgi:hypothetical protein